MTCRVRPEGLCVVLCLNAVHLSMCVSLLGRCQLFTKSTFRHFRLTFLFAPCSGCTIENCSKCPDATKCTKCRAGYYLNAAGTACLVTCPNGFASVPTPVAHCLGERFFSASGCLRLLFPWLLLYIPIGVPCVCQQDARPQTGWSFGTRNEACFVCELIACCLSDCGGSYVLGTGCIALCGDGYYTNKETKNCESKHYCSLSICVALVFFHCLASLCSPNS